MNLFNFSRMQVLITITVFCQRLRAVTYQGDTIDGMIKRGNLGGKWTTKYIYKYKIEDTTINKNKKKIIINISRRLSSKLK